MAKGRGGKGQSTATANGPQHKKAGDREDQQHTQVKGQRNRIRNKKDVIQQNEEPKDPITEDTHNSNHVAEKKEVLEKVHPKVQPTTEQLMIAKIIDHSDDPHQRKKIQQVMDVTGKPEDEVATALFDAGWDESRAVELLLEDGDHLSAWEETGKKKKSKKSTTTEKDDWDDDEGFIEGREKSSKSSSRGPPRMRGRGDSRGGKRGDSSRDFTENGNADQVVPSGRPGRGSRGGRGGGGRGGGNRNFSNRQQSDRQPRDGPSSNTGGFQGSIDTWNPNPAGEQTTSTGDRGSDHRGGRSGRGSRGGRGGGSSGKDAFDNAGNWGDDFPQADDWDNEEYTGSLKDTKIFTSSQAGGGGPKQKTPPNQQPQQQQQQQPPVPTQQPGPVGVNSQRGGNSFAASLTNGPTSSYSQSIDLSTLLQKPTTQSSVGSSAAAPGAQFNQQAATETLKAVVGIGQNTSSAVAPGGGKEPMYSYAQASAFTSINKNQGSRPNQANTKPATQGVVGGHGGRAPTSNRMPSASAKIPAVEMPGDSLGRLDVSFGALDLQFGGSASANSESMSGGFEFGTSSNEDKTSSTSKPTSTGDVTSFAPSAKEVNKSLSNALTGGTGPGKLNAVSAPANTAHNTTQQADSFSKAAQAVNVTVSSSPITANQPQAPTGSSGFGNKPQDLTGYNYNYKGYNNYQQYQYPNSNNYSSSAQQTGSSQYKAGAGGGQYDKYESSAQLQNNPTAVLGLASTSTTNALSGKVSATTASKVNMPNLPPGVASMLHHPQYMATGLAPAAFYGLQQPMYGAYGNTGFEDLAAIQRATASAAGLHTLPTTGFYDPNNQFAAATSLGTAVAANNRNDGNTNLNSLTGVSTTSSSAIGSSSASSGFGSTSTSTVANDSTSSPGPNAITTTASGSQHHVQQQQQHPQTQQQQQQQQQQNAFNLAATNALAAQQMPPGYAYFYGNMAGTIPAAYGAAAATPSHVYQPTAMTVPGAGATATSQFQKGYGTNNYGSGYDTLGQQGNKDFTNSYSSNGQSKSTGGSAGAGSGKGHQYWGNTLTSAPLW